MNHNLASVKLDITGSFTGKYDDKGFGIRDLTLQLDLCSTYCTSCDNNECFVCTGNRELVSGMCLCVDPYFEEVTTGLCKYCYYRCGCCGAGDRGNCCGCDSNRNWYSQPRCECNSDRY